VICELPPMGDFEERGAKTRSQMTAMIDQSARTVCQLIDSCYRSQEGFRSAAEAVDDTNLKRLLDIYAQQRTRFAEELRECMPMPSPLLPDFVRGGGEAGSARLAPDQEAANVLEDCLESDRRTLALYREALADRAIPTRAHFLISAQCSLLERVHDRMYGLLSGFTRGPVNRTNLQGERARV
jgi:hypothetical protein